MVVVIFYATALFTYAQPKAMGVSDSNKMVSVLYVVVVPFCNTVIYSLRNQDVKEVLRKIINGRNVLNKRSSVSLRESTT